MQEPRPVGFTVPVTVHIPDTLYKRLAVAGRHHGATVADLAAEVLRRALAAPQPTGGHRGGNGRERRSDAGKPRRQWTDEDTATLIARHAEGIADAAIARELGWNGVTVHTRRVALGLPANFRGRRRLTEDA